MRISVWRSARLDLGQCALLLSCFLLKKSYPFQLNFVRFKSWVFIFKNIWSGKICGYWVNWTSVQTECGMLLHSVSADRKSLLLITSHSVCVFRIFAGHLNWECAYFANLSTYFSCLSFNYQPEEKNLVNIRFQQKSWGFLFMLIYLNYTHFVGLFFSI